jgi:hypothetical protein
MAFTIIQLLVDVVLFAGLAIVLLGRGWRRRRETAEEPAGGREFLASLTALVEEMKAQADRLEARLEAKRREVDRATALADDRLARIEAAALRAGPESAAGAVPIRPVPVRSAEPPSRRPAPAVDHGGSEALDDDARAERYRQAVDFARKGWDADEIARQTRLPRGEVDLLLKTRGKAV